MAAYHTSAIAPRLEISGPEKEGWAITLSEAQTRIGRLAEENDVVLPDRLVTGSSHCKIVRADHEWFVVDDGSTNGTHVRAESQLIEVKPQVALFTQDVIRVPARDGAQPEYWWLTFVHRDQRHLRSSFVYDEVSGRLLVRWGGRRPLEIKVRPKVRDLALYMIERNREAEKTVLCKYTELKAAVWPGEGGHDDTEVNQLIAALRKELREDPKRPEFIENERGVGFRLDQYPEAL